MLPKSALRSKFFFFKETRPELSSSAAPLFHKTHTCIYIRVRMCTHSHLFVMLPPRCSPAHMFTQSTCITHIAHAFDKAAGGIVMSLSA